MAAPNAFLHENVNMLQLVVPNNYTGAASTDLAFSMKNNESVCIVICTGAWAGGTAAVTLLQGTGGAGTATLTGSKALNFSQIWTKTLTSDLPTNVAVVSNTFNLTAANTMYIIEVPASTLDMSNNFNTVICHVATPGSNADYYNIIGLMNLPRFAAASPPTVLAD